MKKIICAVIFGLSALPAMAQNTDISIELLLGNTTQKIDSDDGDDTSVGIRGTYNLNQNVGLEASYQNYGEASWNYIDSFGDRIGESADTSAFNLSVRGSVPLENGLSLHARAGLSFWDVDVEATDTAFPGQTFSGSDSGNDIFYGVGVQYSVNEKLTVGLEYTLAEYEVEPDGDFDGATADLELDTLAITFGMKL